MTFDWFPEHYAIFTELEDLVKQILPQEYETFRIYNMDLAFKLRYLEVICLRYRNDKTKWKQTAKRLSRFIENSESLSEDELQEESRILAKQTLQYSELLNLDIDSFFIFARILLDRIPYLLRPLYKGIVAEQEVATRDFREHLKWFKKHPESILDSTLYDRMISFGEWFEEELREPRNEWIVHPKWSHIRSSIGFDGEVERLRYESRRVGEKREWMMVETTELPEIPRLFERIIGFLKFLNKHFSEKITGKKRNLSTK